LVESFMLRYERVVLFWWNGEVGAGLQEIYKPWRLA
jgi:hypothetical protein